MANYFRWIRGGSRLEEDFPPVGKPRSRSLDAKTLEQSGVRLVQQVRAGCATSKEAWLWLPQRELEEAALCLAPVRVGVGTPGRYATRRAGGRSSVRVAYLHGTWSLVHVTRNAYSSRLVSCSQRAVAQHRVAAAQSKYRVPSTSLTLG